jgi:transposase-like protein
MTGHTETLEFALSDYGGAHDPLEDEVRQRVRGYIEAIFGEELAVALGRGRDQRSVESKRGQRDGHRDRQVIGTFGPEVVKVPRARLVGDDGRTGEWRSKSLRRYQRLTKKAVALIASVYLAGTNTRRVKRALFGLFDGAVSKDIVSRAWRKVKTDWEAWCARDLADEDVIRLILDGTVVKTRIDRKATGICVLAAIGVRRDGQKVLLSIRNMGGESKAAWRMFLRDLDARGLRAPDFIIVDGAPGLDAALTELWPEAPVQRCTVHKHRNLLAHTPKHLHDELTEDYRDMIYAETRAEVERRRRAFLRKWRLKCKAVADSLEEAGHLGRVDKTLPLTALS